MFNLFNLFDMCSHTSEIFVMCNVVRFCPIVTLNSKSQDSTGFHTTRPIATDGWWLLLLRAVESDHKDLMLRSLRLSASPGVNSSPRNFQENQTHVCAYVDKHTHTHTCEIENS